MYQIDEYKQYLQQCMQNWAERQLDYFHNGKTITNNLIDKVEEVMSSLIGKNFILPSITSCDYFPHTTKYDWKNYKFGEPIDIDKEILYRDFNPEVDGISDLNYKRLLNHPEKFNKIKIPNFYVAPPLDLAVKNVEKIDDEDNPLDYILTLGYRTLNCKLGVVCIFNSETDYLKTLPGVYKQYWDDSLIAITFDYVQPSDINDAWILEHIIGKQNNINPDDNYDKYVRYANTYREWLYNKQAKTKCDAQYSLSFTTSSNYSKVKNAIIKRAMNKGFPRTSIANDIDDDKCICEQVIQTSVYRSQYSMHDRRLFVSFYFCIRDVGTQQNDKISIYNINQFILDVAELAYENLLQSEQRLHNTNKRRHLFTEEELLDDSEIEWIEEKIR